MDAKRTIMGQSYPIYACTHVNHACYSLVHVTFCGRESFFSKTYKNCSTCRNKLYEKNVWEKSNNTYSLSIRVQTTRRRSRGGEMGEFSLPPPPPPFFWVPFFLFFLITSTRLWFYYITTKIHPHFKILDPPLTTINHISILFFITIWTSKMVFLECVLKNVLCDTLTQAAWQISQSDFEISSNCGKI